MTMTTRARSGTSAFAAVVASVAALIVVSILAITGPGGGSPRVAQPAGNPPARTIVAPNVTGLPLSQAIAKLRGAGLEVDGQNLRALANNSVRGTVVAQNVTPGASVPAGEVVGIVLSAGRHPHPVTRHLVLVGSTCEVIWPPPSGGCVGGPLLVPLVSA